MSHEIETMAYVGKTPWHGLGNTLSPNQPLEVWSKQAGMDWSIKKAPVNYIAGGTDYLGEPKSFEDKYVLYRSDTHAPLSIVSPRYKVVQPAEILEFYRDLTEVSGFELETAGVLKGGKKIWALAKTGQSTTLKGNDVTNGYLLLATACDGTMATTAHFTSIRVVCNNTLAVALNGAQGAVKVRHTTSFNPQEVKQQLGVAFSDWDEFMYRMKIMSERRISPKEAQKYVSELFIPNQKTADICKAYERSIARTLDLFNGRGIGSDLISSKGTLFGLLNAVTEYVDHERRAISADHRLDSAWFGPGAQLKQDALKGALMLVA
ncbi:MAG: DUF932 domain-containing protein [Colwellia sp.]